MNLPNKLTLGRIFAVPVFVILYVTGHPVWAFIVFVLASITDMLDGKIARKYGLVTNFGKIMDPLADKVLVYSAFVLMVADGKVPAWMLIVILAREFIVSGVRTVAAADGTVIAADIYGKLKTVFQMVAVPLLVLGEWPWPFVAVIANILLWISLILTVVSGVNYCLKNKDVFSM